MADGYISQIKTPDNKVYLLKDSEKTDENVKQSSNTEDKEFPIILKNTNNTTDETAGVKYAGGITVNPSDKTITADEFIGNLKVNKLIPINEITYPAYTCSADNEAKAVLFFGKVTINDTTIWQAPWTVRYRVYISTTEASTQGWYDCNFTVNGSTVNFYINNNFYSTSYRPIWQHRLLYPKNSYSSYGAYIGIRIQSSRTPTTLARVCKVELLETINCTVELLSSLKRFDEIYVTTNNIAAKTIWYYTDYNATDAGLRVSGNANSNDTGYYILTNGFRMTAGPNKVSRYTLFGRIYDGTYESFTITSNTTAATKEKNPHGFLPDGKIYYNSAGGEYTGAVALSVYEQYHSIDYRYTFNITTTSIPANTPTYIKWIYTDGLLYLADEWFAVTLPTTEDGFIYQRIGSNYYGSADYRASLLLNNPYYIYKNGSLQVWNPTHLSAITGANNLKTIETISGDDTSGLLKKTAANTWTLDTNTYLTAHRTYTTFTGKPTENQAPGFGDTFTIQQINQNTTGQVSGTDRTVTIPSLPTTATRWPAWGEVTGKPSTFAPSAHTHYELATIGDKRNEDTTPDTYKNRIIFQGLKKNSTINSPYTDTYSYLVGLRGWSDSSGGNSHELAFNINGIYRRQGATDTWGDWLHLLDSDNTAAGTNNAATLTWNTTYTIAKINDTDIKFTTMAKPSYAFTDLTKHPTTLSGYGITDAKITSGVITLGSNTITPVTSVNGHTGSSVNVTAADLGLSNALHFIGITSTELADESTTATLTPKSTNSLSKTTGFVDGDVVMDGDQLREYVWSGNAWRLLGVTTSTEYTQPTSTATNTWIAQISQGTDGRITATTGSLNTSGTWSGNAATATKLKDNATNTTRVFYRGDNTWSNILKQTSAAVLGIDTNSKIGTAVKDLHFTVGSGSGTGINDGNAGGITIGTDTASYGGIYWQSSGSYGLRLHFATTGSFANGAYTRMLITHDGKVGIGTLSPDKLLTVNGEIKGTALYLRTAASNPSASAGARIEFSYYNSANDQGKPVYLHYCPNDSYRAPAGLKVFGGSSATPAWFEVEGNVYAAAFKGNADTATTATNLSAAPTITSGGTATVTLSANTAYTLTVGGKSVIFKTPADANTNTATAKDNILDGSNSGTEITYAPYTTRQTDLTFDTAAAKPTGTDRLNLNGNFHATNLYGDTAVINEQVTLQWNNSDQALEFVFV